MRKSIRYKGGYKYQLVDQYMVLVRIIPGNFIQTDYINLGTDGQLVIKKGYAWDGPSGPTVDTATFMRGSLVHDALYQLMRMRLLENEKWRKEADKELRRICLEDGMPWLRAWWVYQGVRIGGKKAASTGSLKKVHTAP